MSELFISETVAGRFVVATVPGVEHPTRPEVVANFASRNAAESWAKSYQDWQQKLRGNVA